MVSPSILENCNGCNSGLHLFCESVISDFFATLSCFYSFVRDSALDQSNEITCNSISHCLRADIGELLNKPLVSFKISCELVWVVLQEDSCCVLDISWSNASQCYLTIRLVSLRFPLDCVYKTNGGSIF